MKNNWMIVFAALIVIWCLICAGFVLVNTCIEETRSRIDTTKALERETMAQRVALEKHMVSPDRKPAKTSGTVVFREPNGKITYVGRTEGSLIVWRDSNGKIIQTEKK